MKNLEIDHWSKGVASFFAAAAIASVAVSEREIFVMCLGGFFFGIGEWINHTIYTKVSPAPGGMFHGTVYIRENSLYGISLIILGVLVFCIGMYKFIGIPNDHNAKKENKPAIESLINK